MFVQNPFNLNLIPLNYDDIKASTINHKLSRKNFSNMPSEVLLLSINLEYNKNICFEFMQGDILYDKIKEELIICQFKTILEGFLSVTFYKFSKNDIKQFKSEDKEEDIDDFLFSKHIDIKEFENNDFSHLVFLTNIYYQHSFSEKINKYLFKEFDSINFFSLLKEYFLIDLDLRLIISQYNKTIKTSQLNAVKDYDVNCSWNFDVIIPIFLNNNILYNKQPFGYIYKKNKNTGLFSINKEYKSIIKKTRETIVSDGCYFDIDLPKITNENAILLNLNNEIYEDELLKLI